MSFRPVTPVFTRRRSIPVFVLLYLLGDGTARPGGLRAVPCFAFLVATNKVATFTYQRVIRTTKSRMKLESLPALQ